MIANLVRMRHWLAKVALVVWICSLSSPLSSPALLSAVAVEVAASGLDIACGNVLSDSVFSGEFSQTTLVQTHQGQALDQSFKGISLGSGGAAWSNSARSWSACAHSTALGGECFVCDRPDTTTAFEWSYVCYSMAPDDREARDSFGAAGAAWSSTGLSWSACSRAASVESKQYSGQCYVCDRPDVETPFQWNKHCYSMAPDNLAAGDRLGYGGAAWSTSGLSWSACSPQGELRDNPGGICYVCDRPDTQTVFQWDKHCYPMVYDDVESDENFGEGGAAWSNDGLSWSACAERKDANGVFDTGTCYVCARDNTSTNFEWSNDCYPMVPDDVASQDNFGVGGAAWSSDGLSWSACSYKTNKASKCYVCDRPTATTTFEWSKHCYSMVPDDLEQTDQFANGDLSSTTASWSSSGLSWSACSAYAGTGGKCYVCDRPNAETRFKWSDHCFSIAPDDSSKFDFFGRGGVAWSSTGRSWSACSPGADVNGVEDVGQCYICEFMFCVCDWIEERLFMCCCI